METIKLKQSWLALIQYDHQQTLFLTTKSGKQYKYAGFSQTRWEELKRANNKGSHIANTILTGKNSLQGVFVKNLTAAEINHITNFQKYLAI